MVYTVDDDGRVASMRAYWEPERTMATFRHGLSAHNLARRVTSEGDAS